MEPPHRLDVVVEDLGPRREHGRSASSSTPRKSGVSTSTEALGQLAPQRADRGRVVPGAAVGEVVAVDGRDDDVRSPMRAAACASAQRLERVGGCSGRPELTAQ